MLAIATIDPMLLSALSGGIAALIVLVPFSLYRKKYRPGRTVRFTSSDSVVRQGQIVNRAKKGRLFIRAHDGTEYEINRSHVTPL